MTDSPRAGAVFIEMDVKFLERKRLGNSDYTQTRFARWRKNRGRGESMWIARGSGTRDCVMGREPKSTGLGSAHTTHRRVFGVFREEAISWKAHCAGDVLAFWPIRFFQF